jgi:hypothetical protein
LRRWRSPKNSNSSHSVRDQSLSHPAQNSFKCRKNSARKWKPSRTRTQLIRSTFSPKITQSTITPVQHNKEFISLPKKPVLLKINKIG